MKFCFGKPANVWIDSVAVFRRLFLRLKSFYQITKNPMMHRFILYYQTSERT